LLGFVGAGGGILSSGTNRNDLAGSSYSCANMPSLTRAKRFPDADRSLLALTESN
jgi:hypothetical protein